MWGLLRCGHVPSREPLPFRGKVDQIHSKITALGMHFMRFAASKRAINYAQWTIAAHSLKSDLCLKLSYLMRILAQFEKMEYWNNGVMDRWTGENRGIGFTNNPKIHLSGISYFLRKGYA